MTKIRSVVVFPENQRHIVMKIYSCVEHIKDFFNRTSTRSLSLTSTSDAALVSSLCSNVEFLRAKNGLSYFYCFMGHAENVDVCEYLLRRNGFLPRRHISRYMGGNGLVLRIPKTSYVGNAAKNDFLKNVRMNFEKHMGWDYSQQVAQIRAEMAQKTK